MMRTAAHRSRYLIVAAFLATGACTSNGSEVTETTPATVADTNPTEITPSTVTEDTSSVLAVLPDRSGPARETTGSVPHIQIDAELVPEVDAELRRRAYLLPGVEQRPTVISLPGTDALWLADDLELARPDVLLSGREFGHIHPDGSLHLWLPVERAEEVEATKWGELHPWAERDDFWDGTVMLFTPESQDEVDVSIQLIVDAYNYIVGADLDPTDFE